MKVVRIQVEIIRPTFCNNDLMLAGESCEMRIQEAKIIPAVEVERATSQDAPETAAKAAPKKSAKKASKRII